MQWLWGPYIPFGKLTIIQGDPGEGKTTLALRLAAACSSGNPPPGMEPMEPFNVIYQSAEDGMGDTIKPRLMDAGADLDRVLSIVEDKKPLSLLDERIEKGYHNHGKEFCSSHRIREECLDVQVAKYAESLRASWVEEQSDLQQLYKQWSLRQPVLNQEIARLREEIRQHEEDIDELLMLRIQSTK